MIDNSKTWTEDEIKEIVDQAIVDAFGDDDDQKLWSEDELEDYIESHFDIYAKNTTIVDNLISNLPWIVLYLGFFVCIGYGFYLISEYESQPAVICMESSRGLFGNKDLGMKCLEALQKK